MQLFPLCFGQERVPRRLSLQDGGDALLDEPMTGALVETDAGLVLLDTGPSPDLLDPPEALRGCYPDGLPRLRDPDPLPAALARVGVDVGDLALVAVSHLHVDHTGGLRHFAGGPEVVVQRDELAYARNGATAEEGYWSPDWEIDGLRWRAVEGDVELAPGVRAIATPGHTPGHQSFVVDLPGSGRWVLACDAIELADGIRTHTPVGAAGPADDPADRRRSHERLVDLAAGGRLVPGHDAEVWAALTAAGPAS